VEMSQHFEMTDATPLACSVIVIQSYAKVASTLLHFTNQIGVLKGSIGHKLQYLRTPIRYLYSFLPISTIVFVFLSDYGHGGYPGDSTTCMGDEVG